MKNGTPKYKILYDELCDQIQSGAYEIDSKLPSETQLMGAYGFSRQTVRLAMEKLVSNGYIHKIQGSGSFVCRPPVATLPNSKSILLMIMFADHYYFPLYITSIENALKNSGYSLTVMITNNDLAEEERQLLAALETDYAGILIFPTQSAMFESNLYLYKRIQQLGIPCIQLGGRRIGVDLPYVLIDDYRSGELATEYLIKNGHSSIACIMNNGEYSARLRYAGYVGALNRAGLALDLSRVFWFDYDSFEDFFSHSNADALMQKLEGVTAVFCFNDNTSVQLCLALISRGKSVPDDISIIGCDNSYLCEVNHIKLTSISQDPYEVGKVAIKNLLQLILNRGYPASCVFEPAIVERQSVKALSLESTLQNT